MSNTCLFSFTPTTTTITSICNQPNNLNTARTRRPFSSRPLIHRRKPTSTITCLASSESLITELDLYDLMGIDRTCNQSQIKMAYRSLQKRCHPDIAGPAGHDMAIILNQAYSVLSNPSSRLAYDKEQAKIEELRGYTGRPIYSVWSGSENEQRAVFVDEVKCVGCLKCALFADKTFAIESVYGRARVVAQWADPEHQIQSAIDSCPVDCISVVDRSDLAALEFLMSKQPRGNVRVGVGNAVGSRVSNIFVEVKKFQTRFAEASCKQSSKETDLQRNARMSAIQAIRSISNWLYWQAPGAQASTTESQQIVVLTSKQVTEPNIKKLRDAAAAARKRAQSNTMCTRKHQSTRLYLDEYWTPSMQALPPSRRGQSSPVSTPRTKTVDAEKPNRTTKEDYKTQPDVNSPLSTVIPLVSGAIATVIVSLHITGETTIGLNKHIGGSMVLEMVNSPWLQATLAGVTWYTIALMIIRLIEAARGKN